jgi:hypothetical protein
VAQTLLDAKTGLDTIVEARKLPHGINPATVRESQ